MQAKRAVVTGASSGIGAAAARALTEAGYQVRLGARRLERLEEVAQPLGAEALQLDVTDPGSVERFTRGLDRLDLLVNNAGGAKGTEALAESSDELWRWMWEANVLGTVRMTRRLLPALLASGAGHVVNVGSIAGFETYPGGSGYTAAKHGVRALTRTLRLELLGQPVRVTEICPGLVETEFSLVRFDGDADRARAVYKGMTPLAADDVADAIVWAATRPSHVNIDEIVIRPRDQATAYAVHRRPTPEES
jgi:NADP-dependent 3-hydroxy acid dehydrogenase YdfG